MTKAEQGGLFIPLNADAANTPLSASDQLPILQNESRGGAGGVTVPVPKVTTLNDIAAFGLPTETIADATYTLTQEDIGDFLNFTAGNVTLTIPEDASVTISVDSQFNGMFTGTGNLTVSPENGNVSVISSGNMTTVGPNGVLGLKKYAADTWLLYGTLA